MEPHREEEQQLMWGTGTAGDANNRPPAAAACCLRPVAPASSSARHALVEQEVLYRADLQLAAQAGGGDRRRERMIKNRASAARSRARRHAYVNELEKEVRLLHEENDQLRKLCEQVTEGGSGGAGAGGEEGSSPAAEDVVCAILASEPAEIKLSPNFKIRSSSIARLPNVIVLEREGVRTLLAQKW
ncbi:hypothetical protein ACP70R_001336 [Stipagrostis hirtigluma subsp. patula]